MGSFDKQVPFLTRYAIIRSAGSLELALKNIIGDYCEIGASSQAKRFLYKNFRRRALNLSYDTICQSLNYFDDEWSVRFKAHLGRLSNGPQWRSDLDSLIDLRNDFAHGGKPTASFEDIYQYFRHGRRVIVLERCILRK